MAYQNVCWNCHSFINGDWNVQCNMCNWYICDSCYHCRHNCSDVEKNHQRVKGMRALKEYSIKLSPGQFEQYMKRVIAYNNADAIAMVYALFLRRSSTVPTFDQVVEYFEVYNRICDINKGLRYLKKEGLFYNLEILKPSSFVFDKSLDIDKYIKAAKNLIENRVKFSPIKILSVMKDDSEIKKFKVLPMESLLSMEATLVEEYIADVQTVAGYYNEIVSCNRTIRKIINIDKSIMFHICIAEEFFYDKSLDVSKYIESAKLFIKICKKITPINVKICKLIDENSNLRFTILSPDYFFNGNLSELEGYMSRANKVISVCEMIIFYNTFLFDIKTKNKEFEFEIFTLNKLLGMDKETRENYLKMADICKQRYNLFKNATDKIIVEVEKATVDSANFKLDIKEPEYFLGKEKSVWEDYIVNIERVLEVEKNIKRINKNICVNFPKLMNNLREAQSFVSGGRIDKEGLVLYIKLLKKLKEQEEYKFR